MGWLSRILGLKPHTHTWENYQQNYYKRSCKDCGLVQWLITPGELEEHPRWVDVEHRGDKVLTKERE